MTPLAPEAQALVDAQTAYKVAFTATAVRGDDAEDLDVVGGSITQDVRTAHRWSGRLDVRSERVPLDPASVFANLGTEVTVRAGVRMLDDSVSLVPFGVLPVMASDISLMPRDVEQRGRGAAISLSLGDRSSLVAAHRFESPLTCGPGLDLADAAARVITDRVPRLTVDLPRVGMTVGDVTDGLPYMFGGSSAVDPWAEVAELLSAVGLRIWFDRAGEVVIDTPPSGFRDPRRVRPEQAQLAYTKRPPNVVVVRSSLSENPAWGMWEDDDPDSPTYADGPYGRVTMFAEAPVRGDAQAATAARRIGQAIRGRGGAWRVTRSWDPTWDPDDGAWIPVGLGREVVVAVDSVTFDLGGTTTLQCRTDVAGDTE